MQIGEELPQRLAAGVGVVDDDEQDLHGHGEDQEQDHGGRDDHIELGRLTGLEVAADLDGEDQVGEDHERNEDKEGQDPGERRPRIGTLEISAALPEGRRSFPAPIPAPREPTAVRRPRPTGARLGRAPRGSAPR